MKKKVVSMLMASCMILAALSGCGSGGNSSEGTSADNSGSKDGVKEFTAFFSVPHAEINEDNEIQQIIAEKTGVKVKETWLTGQTAEEAVGTLIAGGEYPDFVDAGDGSVQMYEAGALVAAMMNMRLKRAMPAIIVGVIVAGIIVTTLTYGAGALF